jgi:hypothetical protein
MIPEAGVEGLDSLDNPPFPGELLALSHGQRAGAVIDEAVNPEVCAAIVREIVPRIVRATDGGRRRSDQRILRSRPSWDAGLEGIGAPMTRPREDWIVVLDALVLTYAAAGDSGLRIIDVSNPNTSPSPRCSRCNS